MCRRTDIDQKLMSNIREMDMGYKTPCYIWQGSHSGSGRGGGYPRMSLDGQTVAVHIVSFTNKNGFIPGKKQIDHKCNQRMCIREDHLQMVTHKRNQKLRIQRSRKATDVLSPEHSQLSSNDAPSVDAGRGQLLQLFRVSEDENQASAKAFDGRYLPDESFW